MFLRCSIWLAMGVLVIFPGCGDPSATTQPGDAASTDRPVGPSLPTARAEELVDSGAFPGRTHWVQTGETLYSLARRYYGDESQWRKIYTANQRRLRDANNLPVGTKLIIPP